jgi:PKD repeat protein
MFAAELKTTTNTTYMNLKYKKIILGILANVSISISASAVSDALKIKVINGSTSDETVIRFLPGATSGFDGSYDAYKLFSSSPVSPAAFTRIDSVTPLSVNALPALNTQSSIALYTHIKVAGTYTFQAIELGSGFPAGVVIKLEDLQTGISYNFRNGQSFSLALQANTVSTSNRFIVHFSPAALTNISSILPTCHGSADASITVTKPGNINWSYELKISGVLVKADSAVNETTQITGLGAGLYVLYTHAAPNTTDSNLIVITEPLPVTAEFSSDSDSALLSAATFHFTNSSSNASFYSWDFGDGSSTTDSASAIHQYQSSGSFIVSLMAADSAGCTSQTTKEIFVLANPEIATSVSEIKSLQMLTIKQRSGLLEMQASNDKPSDVRITIYNNMGQILYHYQRANVIITTEYFQLNESGTYIIDSMINGKKESHKISFIR